MTNQDWESLTSLRKATTNDYSFLESLYRVGREAELAMTPFTAQEKDRFIQQQFAAQTQHYHTNYCSDFFNIIEVDGNNAGRFFVDYWSNEIRIVDISLLPEFQNSGLGTYLMKKILKEGHAQDKPVTIHVEEQNPARRLYERLGFKEKSRFNDVYILMECVA
jgi:GNAT superfamily N-acetyltransferase